MRTSRLDSLKDEIAAYYASGHSLNQTAGKYQTVNGNLRHFFKKHGIKTRSIREGAKLACTPERNAKLAASQRQRTYKLTPEQKEEVVRRYLNGEGSCILAREYGLASHVGILKILWNRGIETRRCDEYRKYSLNESSFDVLSDECCYWLGFLAADGTISRDSRYFAVHLCLRDSPHLEKLKSFIGSNHPIHNSKPYRSVIKETGQVVQNTGSCRLMIYSARIVQRLSELGIKEERREHGIHPDLVCSPHFWRGLIDGDGCLHQGKDGKIAIVLVGDQSMVESFVRFFRVVSPECRVTARGPKHKVWRAGTAGKHADKLIQALYGCGGPSLDRKMAIAQTLRCGY